MKRVLGVVFMFLGATVGLAFLYIGAALMLFQIAYGGVENLLVDVLFMLLGAGFIFLAVRWGVSHEKRILAILFFIGSILFLVLSINMFGRFAASVPTPSDEWLQSMAVSRAYTLGEYPAIDKKLVTQARIATSGTAIVSLTFSVVLAWFGKNWLKNQVLPVPQNTPISASRGLHP